MTFLPLTDADGTRRRRFLETVRAYDPLDSVAAVDGDLLVTIGLGLAVEAYEGRFDGARALASARFGVPRDVVELLAAAALATLAPTMGAALLMRPTDDDVEALRAFLRTVGYSMEPKAPRSKRPARAAR